MNKELGLSKMVTMKNNEGKAAVPDSFDDKVDAFLEDKRGTRDAVMVALMAKGPAARAHMFEGCRLAFTKATYERMKRADISPVLGIFGGKAVLYPHTRKVKAIQVDIEYPKAVADQVDAYVERGQTYLFENGEGGTLKTQAITKQIKVAFQRAGVGALGVQALRRIAETANENDVTKTVAEKEAFSLQMNHSRAMGSMYAVRSVKGVERTEAAQEAYKRIGALISGITTRLVSVVEEKELVRLEGLLKKVK